MREHINDFWIAYLLSALGIAILTIAAYHDGHARIVRAHMQGEYYRSHGYDITDNDILAGTIPVLKLPIPAEATVRP